MGPLEIDEATAPLVRRAAKLFLATGSMGEVQRFLGSQGYERWTPALRKSLSSPQLAGIRTVDGVMVTGTWPAILDVATHRAILAELDKPERGRGRPAGERWLLTGLLVCGKCGQSVAAGGDHRGEGKGRRRSSVNVTTAALDRGTCGPGAARRWQPIRSKRWVEAAVLATVTPQMWRKLRSARARRAPRDADAAEADLVVLARRFGAGELLEVEWNAARSGSSSGSLLPRRRRSRDQPICRSSRTFTRRGGVAT